MSPTDATTPFAQIHADYARLEPGTSDTWNPLHCDVELRHRMVLLDQLVHALRTARVDPTTTRVFDVGCGNGRSTRMYLDVGFEPDALTGVDLRAGALERATHLHPAITFAHYDGVRLPAEDASVDWVSTCTVFSSIGPAADRRRLADEITRVLRPGGHLFYWDLRTANDFAGGDLLDTKTLLPELDEVQRRPARIVGFEEREIDAGSTAHTHLTDAPTHDGVLLRR